MTQLLFLHQEDFVFGFKLEVRFRLGIREKLLKVRAVRQWHRVPREALLLLLLGAQAVSCSPAPCYAVTV